MTTAGSSGLAAVRPALLVLAGAVLLLVVLTTSLPQRPYFMSLLNNAGHAPVFGALAFVALKLAELRWPSSRLAGRRYLSAFLAAVLAGIAVEAVQSVTARDASWFDVAMDAAGAASVLGFAAFWDRAVRRSRLRPLYRSALVLVVLTSLAMVLAPLAAGAAAYSRRQGIFPVLATFQQPRDLYFVSPSGAEIGIATLPAPWAERPVEPALRVVFINHEYPGFQLWEPEPDWRGYRSLVIDITNPHTSAMVLTMRIHDAFHDQSYEDRFNREFKVAGASRQRVEIAVEDIQKGPQGRDLDLGQVAMMGLFESSQAAMPGRALYVSRVWLE